jgi:hypothetical protein
MLYLGTAVDIPLETTADLRIEEVAAPRQAVERWLSLPYVHFIGAHTGCSCGFPSVSADVPIEFFPGMFDENPDREADLRSVEALLALIRRHMSESNEVQLYAVWAGEEAEPPKGTIELVSHDLLADRFLLNERFLHRITKHRPAPGTHDWEPTVSA